MRVHKSDHRSRRGATVLELAIVFPVLLFMFVGLFISGLGVFRYQQVAMLAREGARWASVHGPTYQNESGGSAPTSTDVYNNAVAPKLAGLDASKLTCTLTMTSNTATVTVAFQWVPEALFSPVTFSNTSIMPITY
jgi:Flp pilus assembly protein TadG